MAVAEPAALTASWQPKLGPPLMSPIAGYSGYLMAIFNGCPEEHPPLYHLAFTDSWHGSMASSSPTVGVELQT